MPLADIVNSTVDELICGTTATKESGKRGPTSKLQQQIDLVAQLPRAKQKFVSEMLDTVIQQAAH